MISTPDGPLPNPVPRALEDHEIQGLIDTFRRAACLAQKAGFDGVEVYAANGYLLDQFLRDGTNKRTGPYGGPLPHRARLLMESVHIVAEVWGYDRVGVRLTPLNSALDMRDSDPVGTFGYVASALNELGLAYLHVMEADSIGVQQASIMPELRRRFQGPLIGNLGHTRETAAAAIDAGQVDAVAFGRPFIANPDLVRRFEVNAPLSDPRPELFYSPGPEGYTDYPVLAA
jgi:N-ethylmaleimide reductase